MIAIVRGCGEREAVRICSDAVAQGIRCVEITIETAQGRDALAQRVPRG